MNFIDAARHNRIVRRKGCKKHLDQASKWIDSRYVLAHWGTAYGGYALPQPPQPVDPGPAFVDVEFNAGGRADTLRNGYWATTTTTTATVPDTPEVGMYRNPFIRNYDPVPDVPLVTWEDLMANDWEYKPEATNIPEDDV